ncbi:GGDEF domain-containing protein [Leptolyngbya sp. 'hensonii']|nr:GGDEF domain-containing protein [Leptolyngbya sp. 'hensonii']
MDRLQRENERLRQQNYDLHLALSTTAEHGDFIEAQLHATNIQLSAEIVERKRAEVMLQTLLEIISRERDDLEIIVQTIMEHGDVVDAQWQLKLNETLRLADLDGLTQIPNRRRFDVYFDYQWRQMTRDQTPLSVILCDIDCFKQYNDAYGHLAGDDCLRQIAQALHTTLKRPSDLVARYGGEEFVAILPQTDAQGAIQVAEQMQVAIARLQIPHSQSCIAPQVTLSMGIASTIPSPLRSSGSLLDEADQRLYLAKQQGKNQIIHPWNSFPAP